MAWIPFIFQDAKQGRHSGILIPQFGFNDIVRPSNTYNRQITNIGYFWAPNDYFDAQVQLDWYNNRYLQYGVATQYRVRDRFVSGALNYQVQSQIGGATGRQISWQHQQNFNVSTSLNANVNYASNSAIIARNTINTAVLTQQIQSQLNFTKRYAWGSFALGGHRRQNISDGSGDMQLPSLTLTPKELDLGSWVTWSPNLSFTNALNFKTPLPLLVTPRTAGGLDSTAQLGSTRLSTFQLATPIRFGSFVWNNSVNIVDSDSSGRYSTTFRAPNLDTPEEGDSITVTQYRKGGFATSVDWSTSVSLPILLRSTWKLVPSVGITNASASGPFAVRNAFTSGGYVHQGKRLNFSASLAPTFFGFLPGIGPISRFRHSISPTISYSYSPASTVSEAFAQAVVGPGRSPVLRSPASQTIQLTLSQNIEGKLRPAGNDTASAAAARKLRILSINTSSIAYDFEQAKEPGRTGWTTSALTNTVGSDLLPGFTLSLTHQLWDGEVGFRRAKFSPFLQGVSTGFSVNSNTLRSLGSLFGLVKRPPAQTGGQQPQPPLGYGGVPLPGSISRGMILNPNQSLAHAGRPFSMNVTANISRTRAGLTSTGTPIAAQNQSSIGLNTSFSPTSFWGVTWSTQYNATKGTFESQQISLARELHEWRASFNFAKAPNGNFSFYFAVFLTDFPEINYKYNQTTIRPQ